MVVVYGVLFYEGKKIIYVLDMVNVFEFIVGKMVLMVFFFGILVVGLFFVFFCLLIVLLFIVDYCFGKLDIKFS